MWIIYIFFAIAVVTIGSVSYLIYRLFARSSIIVAGGLTILILIIMVLLWPIPNHGGVTFLFSILYEEINSELQQRSLEKSETIKQDFSQQLTRRFRAPLQFEVLISLSESWSKVRLVNNIPAWYDNVSHLLWSSWRPLNTTASLPSLQQAKQYCHERYPMGYWALPTEAENLLLWQSGGAELLPDARASTMSYIIDAKLRMEIPTYHKRGSSSNSAVQPPHKAIFMIRCVALSTDAPHGGYSQKDITLADWNRYQLAKVNGRSAGVAEN